MKISLTRLCVIILLSLAAIASCSFAGDVLKAKGESVGVSLSVAGWIPVGFSINASYVDRHRGGLSQNYDEFVGGLFDDGLQLQDAGWLKPTYGNQNLLWTLNSSLGSLRQKMLQDSIKEFESNTFQFKSGSISVGNTQWKFSGYIDKAQGSGSAAFQSFIFVCAESSPGVSVFYWGDGVALEPQNTAGLKELLSKVSSYCKL